MKRRGVLHSATVYLQYHVNTCIIVSCFTHNPSTTQHAVPPALHSSLQLNPSITNLSITHLDIHPYICPYIHLSPSIHPPAFPTSHVTIMPIASQSQCVPCTILRVLQPILSYLIQSYLVSYSPANPFHSYRINLHLFLFDPIQHYHTQFIRFYSLTYNSI